MSLFKQIGKAFEELESTFSGIFNPSAVASASQSGTNEDNSTAIKAAYRAGITKCVFCGAENADTNFFCFGCGKRIGPAINQDSPQARHFQRMSEQSIKSVCGRIDLSSPEGVEAIPENADVYHCSFYGEDIKMSTYLRRIGNDFEKGNNPAMAIACLKKSNEIRMTCREGHNKDEYYSLVRMLARLGFVAEAQKAKTDIDTYFSACGSDNDFYRSSEILIKETLHSANYHHTDLVIMDVMGAACPKCAKYQGRVFSLYGRDTRFPRVPPEFWVYGRIHPGCSHTFWPFIYGVSGDDLSYTLQIQKVSNPMYTRNIIAYSNRPMVDDRPPADIAAALQFMQKAQEEAEHRQYLWDHMIEVEAERGKSKRDYEWLQQNLPDLCPKSYSGYMRMKTQNTRNFQRLQAAAKALGKEL